MRLRYSPHSIEDLENIRRYIAKDNPKAAWVVASFVRRSIRTLEEFPYQGRATERENVRRLVVTNYPYVVYYYVAENEVIVLTVMHGAQER